MNIGDHLRALFNRLKPMPPVLVRIEHKSPDLIEALRKRLGVPPPGSVNPLVAVPIVMNTALPLGCVRLVMSDGTFTDHYVEPFQMQIRERA